MEGMNAMGSSPMARAAVNLAGSLEPVALTGSILQIPQG